jgi:hypothetical protein
LVLLYVSRLDGSQDPPKGSLGEVFDHDSLEKRSWLPFDASIDSWSMLLVPVGAGICRLSTLIRERLSFIIAYTLARRDE